MEVKMHAKKARFRSKVGRKNAHRGRINITARAGSERHSSPADSIVSDSAQLGLRLAFHIHDVSRMRRTAYDQIMKPVGITRAQWWVLAHLSRHDGMMQTQLANVLDVGKASVGALLDRLEAGGLIERRSDPSDKRAKRVFMLRSAHQLMKTLTAEERRFNERVLRGLSLQEREELLRMLSVIKSALSEFELPEADMEEE
jgi:DNA-binding MarR family transcriptional regulator